MKKIMIKKCLAIILFLACAMTIGASRGYSADIGERDQDLLIMDLEKSIAEQEKLLSSLRARYAKLLSRKKQLLEWIEQEKQKLKEKQAKPVQEKIIAQPQAKSNDDRDRQLTIALEKKKKLQDKEDKNYLNLLLKKQKELSAAITKLEMDIASEEKKLKTLKESRKTPNKL